MDGAEGSVGGDLLSVYTHRMLGVMYFGLENKTK